jgi:serine/threonine protein kinase
MLKNGELTIDDFILKEDIGEGNFGKVKLGIYKKTGEEYAIKILNKEKIKSKMKNTVFKENEIATKFNHINVVYVFDIFEDKENCYLIMDFCKKGELFDYIVKHQRLSENEASVFFYQLINGVEYIHSMGIAHRDLKPENLLLTNDNVLKIIDFGLSHEFNGTELLKTKCGSPSYAAPEIICCPYYDGFKTDIWCCGIILYAMLCGFLPFEGDDNTLLFRNILECDPEMPDWLSKASRELIIKILNPDPDERITLDEIKRHKFYLKGKKLCKINYEDMNNIIKNREIRNNKNKENQIEINKENENNILIIDNKNDEQEIKNVNEDKKIKYNYCNTISGGLLKMKLFDKLYNFKNNNSIHSFRKKIMGINININNYLNNHFNKRDLDNQIETIVNKEKNNDIAFDDDKNINVNDLIVQVQDNNNTNYNSINDSNNINNKDKKFTSFLSRLNSYRKPLFLKIIGNSINNDFNENKYSSMEGIILNNNDEKKDEKRCISFLKKFKNNFRKLNQQKKLINNNYLHTNASSYSNRIILNNNINKNNNKNINNNKLNNNCFRDKLYTFNVNTPIHIKKNIPIATELNKNYIKEDNINKVNNSEPKPILYCGNLSININNININHKRYNNASNNKKNFYNLNSNNSTKASSSKKIILKTNEKNEYERYKSNTINSKRNRSNDLFICAKIKDNYNNKINLSKIIQKRKKKNKEKKNLITYTNTKKITENDDSKTSKRKIIKSQNRKRNININNDNKNKGKDDLCLRIFNNNYKTINNLDNNKNFVKVFNNHSQSLKKFNKKI